MKKARSYILISIVLLFHGISYAQVDTLLFDGLKRTYLVHFPPSYDGSSLMPLVIALHPLYGSASSFETMTGFSTKADTENYIVVYPNGTGNPTSWNAGGCCYPASTNNIDDVGFISALIDTLTKHYNIDSTRIYAAGFSNGSMLAYRLAAELSNRIAAIAAGSGQMTFTTINPSRGVPIIHFHALNDHAVPYIGNPVFPPVDTVLANWARINHCTSTPDTIYNANGVLAKQWTAIGTGADVVLYRSNTGGHAWPIGNVSETDVAWDFFKSYPMQSTTAVPTSGTMNMVKYFTLEQNFPNPFNPSTSISFSVGTYSQTSLRVYDMLGQEVATIFSGAIPAGSYTKQWNAEDLPSGIYFYRLQAGTFSETKKLVLVK
jgi:polyhydroxybutyrate depolymerase